MSPFQRSVWLCLLALAPCLAAAHSMQEIIGVGDTVRITAFRHPELTTQARVTEEGKVNVPLVGPLELGHDAPGIRLHRTGDLASKDVQSVDSIRDTADSFSRAFVIEVMGRNAGWLTLNAGIASGSDAILIPEIPFEVDCVDVFRRSEAAGEFADQAVAIGAKGVWFQLGVVDQDAFARTTAAGVPMVMDTCPAIEWRRRGR